MLLSVIFRVSLSLGFCRTWESSGVMWDVKSTIACTFEGTEDSGASSGPLETNIQKASEWSSLALMLRNVISSSVSLGDTLIHSVHSEGLEKSSGKEEASAVSRWVVGETSGKAESSELMGISRTEGSVASDGGVVDGANNSAVGNSHDKSVLFGIVFIVVHDS